MSKEIATKKGIRRKITFCKTLLKKKKLNPFLERLIEKNIKISKESIFVCLL